MTTSGVVSYSISRDNILTDALMIVGALGPDDTASANQLTHTARQLNNIVKALGSDRIALWARKTGYILPVSGTNSTLLGPGGGAATLVYTQTTLSSAAANGATIISVTSATGFGDTFFVGVEQDDATMLWTTQSGAASGTTITLTNGLTATAGAGNYVWVYQTKIQRPLHIANAYIRQMTSTSDIPMEIIAKIDYEMLGMKSSKGVPNQLVYDPQLTNGEALYYPRFSNGKMLITISFQRPFEDFVASTDTPDFPQEWYDPLVLLLATRIAPVYGMPIHDRSLLKADAKEALDLAMGNEPEDASIRFQPDTRANY